jgi:hypothetical protein
MGRLRYGTAVAFQAARHSGRSATWANARGCLRLPALLSVHHADCRSARVAIAGTDWRAIGCASAQHLLARLRSEAVVVEPLDEVRPLGVVVALRIQPLCGRFSALSCGPESPLVGNEQQASAACLSQERSAARVKERQHQHRRPTGSGELGAGCEPPLVSAVVAQSTRSRVRFQSGNPAISRQKLESIADRLWLGNPYFAGLPWDARDPTFRLPCRRSWVRIPSAALEKACICRSFSSGQSAGAVASPGTQCTPPPANTPRERLGTSLLQAVSEPLTFCSRLLLPAR